MKRVAVPALPVDHTTLPSDVAHHLEHVMRAGPGFELMLFDGQGLEQPAMLTAIGPPLQVESTGPAVRQVRAPEVHLLLAVLKHQPMDLAIRMATEAGVHTIHPVITERTVAKGERGDRWQRIVESAASQCGRADVPAFAPIRSLREALEAFEHPFVYGLPNAPTVIPAVRPLGLVIGPAGGFAPKEQLWLARGNPIHLGPHVLRAETAAAIGIALLTRS